MLDCSHQLIFNPKVELCCIDQNLNTLRILGEAVFVTSKETQAKALEIMPSLGQMYSVGDGKLLKHILLIRCAQCKFILVFHNKS